MRTVTTAGTAVAIPRGLRVIAAVAALLVLWALPASAVGVDGVDLRVDLPTGADDRPILDLQAEDPEVGLLVRNTTDEPRDVRVYAVLAEPAQDTGSFSLAGPASAPWFGLADQQFRLDGREEITRSVEVDTRRVPEDASHVAVVLETGTDSTVVTRAARVIELGEHEPFGVPLWLVLLASALLALAIAGHLVDRHRRNGREADAPASPQAATDGEPQTHADTRVPIGTP
jgi:hypothetical protein